jgi:hypothetical protein
VSFPMFMIEKMELLELKVKEQELEIRRLRAALTHIETNCRCCTSMDNLSEVAKDALGGIVD